jgi:carboxylesterase
MTGRGSDRRRRLAAPLLAVLLVLGVVACGDSPLAFEDWWMDSPEVNDPSLNDPDYLLSTRPGMAPADRGRPVVIAVHGFTASTFEWQEFREYAEGNSDVLVSLVLLGGHGRSVEADFRNSTWQQWAQPILDEYHALKAQGYTNVSLAGASTAGALMLQQLADGRYEGPTTPRHFFFIDPIVVPADKTLSLVPLVGRLISGVQVHGTDEEARHWYTNRPAATLIQLNEVINRVQGRLARGIVLPPGTQAKVYKTDGDATADPVSALLIYRGLRTAAGGRIEVQMLPSRLHVFTRLRGRNPALVTPADQQRQRAAFEEMVRRASQ